MEHSLIIALFSFQDATPESSCDPVKSTAIVKYSAFQTPATFARLQCNTDLNLPPSNWLSNSADSYGLQHVLSQSTGFTRFVTFFFCLKTGPDATRTL